MGAAYRGDRRSVARSGEPVVHRGPDFPPLHRRRPRPVMPGNQQQQPVAARDCLLDSAVDRRPGAIEREAVEVEDPIRLDAPGRKLSVPAAVEGFVAVEFLSGTRWETLPCMVEGASRRARNPL